MSKQMDWKCAKDRDNDDWRVEAIDHDSGEVYVAIFSGPDAGHRAFAYYAIAPHLSTPDETQIRAD